MGTKNVRHIELKSGKKISFCVLIPTRKRARLLESLWYRKNMEFLNHPSTHMGLFEEEIDEYKSFFKEFSKITVVTHAHSKGIAAARQRIKERVKKTADPDYYIVTDDNAIYSEDALIKLVKATHRWTIKNGATAQFAGLHSVVMYWDKKKVENLKREKKTSYEKMCWIFMCFPAELYDKYKYYEALLAYDDKHLGLWMTLHGYQTRVYVNSPFSKTRLQPGGSGTNEERVLKQAHDIALLYKLYPEIMGNIMPRIPWKYLQGMKGKDVVKKVLAKGQKSLRKASGYPS